MSTDEMQICPLLLHVVKSFLDGDSLWKFITRL